MYDEIQNEHSETVHLMIINHTVNKKDNLILVRVRNVVGGGLSI